MNNEKVAIFGPADYGGLMGQAISSTKENQSPLQEISLKPNRSFYGKEETNTKSCRQPAVFFHSNDHKSQTRVMSSDLLPKETSEASSREEN